MLSRCAAAACLISLAACASHVTFPSREARVSAHISKPDAPGQHPALVLLHACGGLTPHVARDWPKLLVALGYVVLVPDTTGSRGYRDCSRMPDRFEAQARDAYAALDYLAGQPFVDVRRIAAVGFSMGAITINELIMVRPPRAASRPEFRAFASFYGRCSALNPILVREAPLLQIIPEKDNFASGCVERAKSIRMEAHVLPGAFHAFDQPQLTSRSEDPFGNRMLYDRAATSRSQELLRDFLAKNLK